MLSTLNKKYAAICFALALLFYSSDFKAATTITVNGRWNIYTITLDKASFQLGRGETVQVQAEVVPSDQEIVFFIAENDRL